MHDIRALRGLQQRMGDQRHQNARKNHRGGRAWAHDLATPCGDKTGGEAANYRGQHASNQSKREPCRTERGKSQQAQGQGLRYDDQRCGKTAREVAKYRFQSARAGYGLFSRQGLTAVIERQTPP